MNMEVFAQIVAVGSGVAAVFQFAVLRPLNMAITRLDITLEKMERQLAKMEQQTHSLEVKLAEVDQRAKAAHDRLDEILKIWSGRK